MNALWQNVESSDDKGRCTESYGWLMLATFWTAAMLYDQIRQKANGLFSIGSRDKQTSCCERNYQSDIWVLPWRSTSHCT